MAVLAIVSLSVGFIMGRCFPSWDLSRILHPKRNSERMPAWLVNYKESWYTREIYDKILSLFSKSDLYLNSYLSIMDIATELGTNKVYIARAMKVYSGKNFCQFVNSYRVEYAIKLHKKEPDLKVCDLAYKSGFNSPTAFSIAFKLIKGIPPGEWLRRRK